MLGRQLTMKPSAMKIQNQPCYTFKHYTILRSQPFCDVYINQFIFIYFFCLVKFGTDEFMSHLFLLLLLNIRDIINPKKQYRDIATATTINTSNGCHNMQPWETHKPAQRLWERCEVCIMH